MFFQRKRPCRSSKGRPSAGNYRRRVRILFFGTVFGLGTFLPFEGNPALISRENETGFCGGNCPIRHDGLLPQEKDPTKKSRFSESFLRSATVRVINGHPRGGNPNASFVGIEKGSGVCLENNRGEIFVLTAAHIFQEGIGVVLIQTIEGKMTRARIVLIDPFWDIALAAPAEKIETGLIQISDRTPKVGDRSFIGGYGSNDRFRITAGSVIGYSMTSRQSSYETLRTAGSVRKGDSGGPVVDDENRLIGVVWGTDGNSSYATWNGRIKKILADEKHLAFGEKRSDNRGEKIDPPSGASSSPDSPKTAEPLKESDAAATPESSARQQSPETAESVKASDPPWTPEPPKRSEKTEDVRPKEERRSTSAVRETIIRLSDSRLLQILSLSGVSVPPVFFIVLSLLKRRAKKRRVQKESADKTSLQNREENSLSIIDQNNEYAMELNDLYDLNGRNSVADATCGRLYDLELEGAENSSDPVIASYAQTIRRKIKDELIRIHSKIIVPGS